MTKVLSQPSNEHSATPWELSPQGYILPTHKNPCAMLKLKSPWIEGAWDNDPEAAANAALIVEAVNSYEALKARITELEAALGDTLNMLRAAHMQCGVHHDGNKRVIKARATLQPKAGS